jgi:hypothetical protein
MLFGRCARVGVEWPAVGQASEPKPPPGVLEFDAHGRVVDVGEPPAGDHARDPDVPGADRDGRALIDGKQ